jgi:hypothetical protein
MAPPALDPRRKRCLCKDPAATADGVGSAPSAQWIAGRIRVCFPFQLRRGDEAELGHLGRRCRCFPLAVGLAPSFVVVSGFPDPNWSASRYRTWGRDKCRCRCRPAAGLRQPRRLKPRRRRSAQVRQAGCSSNTSSQPFWSPDSRFMAFFEGGRLKKATSQVGLLDRHDTPTPLERYMETTASFCSPAQVISAYSCGRQPTAITGLDQANKNLNIWRHSSCLTDATLSLPAVAAKRDLRGLARLKGRASARCGFSPALCRAGMVVQSGGTVFASRSTPAQDCRRTGPRRGVPTLMRGKM